MQHGAFGFRRGLLTVQKRSPGRCVLFGMGFPQIAGKIDTKLDCEAEVVNQIRCAFDAIDAGEYLCTYGDDPAGDLAIKIEHGDKVQTVVIEVHAWPQSIRDRIRRELRI